jgi:hypothetical protein
VRTITSEQYHRQFMASHKLCTELETYWDENLPTVPRPGRDQFERWAHVHRYSGEPLRHAIRAAVRRLTRRPFNDAAHPVQFVSAVALHYMNETQAAVLSERAA